MQNRLIQALEAEIDDLESMTWLTPHLSKELNLCQELLRLKSMKNSSDLEKHWGPTIKQAATVRLESQVVREGYYAASDGLTSLIRALAEDEMTRRDHHLRGSAVRIQQAFSDFRHLLDSRYIWD